MREVLRTLAVIVAAVWVTANSIPVQAQDFYKDKTVRFIVGYSPAARLIFIPG